MSDAGTQFLDGDAYERLMGRWSRMAGEKFLNWLAVPNGLYWLDVGCGNGAFTESLIAGSAPAAVRGIDPSEGQLAYARERPGVKVATFEQGDAQALPFKDRTFDVAAMALVIAFLPDPVSAVREMARVVRPGGAVATYMWDMLAGGSPTNPIYPAFRAMGIEPPLPPSAAASSRDALQDIWQRAGLREIETQVIGIPVTYASFDEFWETISLPVGPQGMMIQNMSADLREQLRTHAREQMPTGSSERIEYEAFANAVKGRTAG